MTNKSVKERVTRLYEYLSMLEEIAKNDLSTFLSIPYIQLSAERLLHYLSKFF
ncbi:MAG: hypothetical protein ACP6IS_08100 [Candidatus Asgardarchaeia archaeon]